ncbi:MAG TPA: hypothetical protein VJV23_08345 [Candidatus Polarisedimenticolia bacterium]|nr:hypothetical protein [Candidatus Polarisedimenticolia bacterium]
MRRALLVAADLAREALTSPRWWMIPPMMGLLLPIQMGVTDGLAAGRGSAVILDLRLWLVTNALWPCLIWLGLAAEILFPRKLRGELEPLLAAPISGRELGLGFALPAAGAAALFVAAGIPATLLGYRMGAGRLPADPAWEAAYLLLAVWADSLVAGAAVLHAFFRAQSAGGFLLRSCLALLPLAAAEGALFMLRGAGRRAACLGLLALMIAGGILLLRWAGSRLDRERLLGRI